MSDDGPSPGGLIDNSIISDVRDAYGMFATFRRSSPVMRVELPQRAVYMVLRYDDVTAVLRDAETFSSRIMRVVMGPVMGRTILEMGGQEHTAYRSLVANAFRPNAIERYRTQLVEPLTHEF